VPSADTAPAPQIALLQASRIAIGHGSDEQMFGAK
jgi:hypothetical protein